MILNKFSLKKFVKNSGGLKNLIMALVLRKTPKIDKYCDHM
jgi:hypothetical protein